MLCVSLSILSVNSVVLLFLDGVESDISLIHPDDIHWFVTMDETHHEFSTKGNKGGTTARRYANPSFPRVGERVVEDSHHTTGVYGFTLGGEPLPPLYILSSSAEDEENYKIDIGVMKGLPVVRAKYANAEHKLFSSHVAVRKKGSMDTSLWHDLHRSVYLPCYKGKLSPEPICDPITKKLIRGPLIQKTDAGPGRLSKQAESIEFRIEMAAKGVHIILSLPNGTECTAELDQMFSIFKPACKKSTMRVAGVKMAARVNARMQSKSKDSNATTLPNRQPSQQLEQYLDIINVESDDEHEDGEGDVCTFNVGRSVCNVTIGNKDLGAIVNGFPGDPIEKRPFDFCFCYEKIIAKWIAVGFLPMTGNAVNDPKVRYELGEGGAPEEATRRIELLVADYEECVHTLNKLGLNGNVLDLQPRTVEDDKYPSDEEKQIEHIVKNKLINKSGGLFRSGIIIANCRVVTEAGSRAQVIEEKAKKEKEKKKIDGIENKNMKAVCYAAQWESKDKPVDESGHPKLTKDASIAIVKVLLPRINPNGKLKDFNSMKACVKWLGELAGRGTTWVDEMKQLEEEIDVSMFGANPERLF